MLKPSDTIAVRYSEDLAQYADLRPVVRQAMTLEELLGLVLATTGKHPGRVRAHLRSGTCTYNIYRYWWEGFEIDDATLDAALARFPDPDPARRFHPTACLWMRFADAQEPKPHTLTVEREEATRRRWFRRESFWDFLLALVTSKELTYQDYSYYHRADLYRAELAALDRALLLHQSRRLAPRALAERLARGFEWASLEAACGRS